MSSMCLSVSVYVEYVLMMVWVRLIYTHTHSLYLSHAHTHSGLSISAAMGVRDSNEASYTQVMEVLEFMSDNTRCVCVNI
jgi:hypothetical protein